jgi:2',3'-cyclic-nucleotide 2'-phosphodiesterase (5'-nucleotidase family)
MILDIFYNFVFSQKHVKIQKDMHLKKILIIFFIVAFVSACVEQKFIISNVTGSKIPLDSSTEELADKSFNNYLGPLKSQLAEKMNEIIGIAAEDMRVYAPESLLSNFSADVYRQVASEYLGFSVDIAIVNIKGLRSNIPAGEIKVSKIFELMPFENELVVIWLKGSELSGLLQFFASIGGEGVSGIKMGIKKGVATDIFICGKSLDQERTYVIATNDYLAEGNDGMNQLTKNIQRTDTGIKIREMLIEYIKKETAKGNIITSKLDGRISIY